jgi:hypothetical protein
MYATFVIEVDREIEESATEPVIVEGRITLTPGFTSDPARRQRTEAFARNLADRLDAALHDILYPCECCGAPAGEGNALCPACAESR